MSRYRFRLPEPRRSHHPAWLIVAIVLHGTLLVAAGIGVRTIPEAPTVLFVRLPDPNPRAISLPWDDLPISGGPMQESNLTVPLAVEGSETAVPSAPAEPRFAEVVRAPVEVPDDIRTVPLPPLAEARAVGPPLIGTRRRLGVAYGDGRLWRPTELTPREQIGIMLSVANIDSVMRDRLIDALAETPPDSFALANGGGWRTEIGGKEFGIDGQFITVAGIKIPTMLLALLPISLPEGNIFDAREARLQEAQRQEIVRNAQRQADMEEIRRYIEELRLRNDSERSIQRAIELRRALQAARDSLAAGRDSIIP